MSAPRTANQRLTFGPFRDAPPAAAVEPFEENLVSTGGMSKGQKSAIWQHIKADAPDQVAFFEDPTVKQLIAEGAVAVFPRALVERAFKADKVKA